MLLAADHDVIQTVSSDGFNDPFCKSVIKSSQLHLLRSMERKPSRSLMSSIPYTGVSSRS